MGWQETPVLFESVYFQNARMEMKGKKLVSSLCPAVDLKFTFIGWETPTLSKYGFIVFLSFDRFNES